MRISELACARQAEQLSCRYSIYAGLLFYAACSVATLAKSGPRQDVYDLKLFYPLTIGKQFIYEVEGESVYEIMSFVPWGDGSHFTVHHQYGDVGSDAPWCPRVDDVFAWTSNELLYTDTYSFFGGSMRTKYVPGHVWANRYMRSGKELSSETEGYVYDVEQADCSVTKMSFNFYRKNTTKRLLTDGLMDSSPFTGRVQVVMLTETTLFGKDPNDIFVEEWYFYKHKALGWIPIGSRGLRNGVQQWNERLTAVN